MILPSLKAGLSKFPPDQIRANNVARCCCASAEKTGRGG